VKPRISVPRASAIVLAYIKPRVGQLIEGVRGNGHVPVRVGQRSCGDATMCCVDSFYASEGNFLIVRDAVCGYNE
jgi:hypothetical protein